MPLTPLIALLSQLSVISLILPRSSVSLVLLIARCISMVKSLLDDGHDHLVDNDPTKFQVPVTKVWFSSWVGASSRV